MITTESGIEKWLKKNEIPEVTSTIIGINDTKLWRISNMRVPVEIFKIQANYSVTLYVGELQWIMRKESVNIVLLAHMEDDSSIL